MYDTAIYIGRFEPVHNGHLALLHHALENAHRAIAVIGSAWQARTPKNPFTWQEREAMLRSALPEHHRHRLQVLPVRDYYNESVWVHAVQRAVAAQVPAQAHIALVGHFKDASSGYLHHFSPWHLLPMARQGGIDATAIRDVYFGASHGAVADALAAVEDQIPPSTLGFLHRFAQQLPQSQAFLALQQEWRMLRDYRASWAHSPYDPVFVTVDAVLRCQNHVLLIRRARAPGKGLLAFPGGFIEPRETLWQSCLRELAEETHCALPEAALRSALRHIHAFDHPDRSQRGRTITHAHYFDLGDTPFPAVQADDDAQEVHWISIDQLAALENEFFEDHFHIADHFLGICTED